MASQEESTALPVPTNHISQRLNNQALSCIPNNQLIKSFTALSGTAGLPSSALLYDVQITLASPRQEVLDASDELSDAVGSTCNQAAEHAGHSTSPSRGLSQSTIAGERQLVTMPRFVEVLDTFSVPIAHRAEHTVALLDKPAVAPGAASKFEDRYTAGEDQITEGPP
jgi:hypothetical protein